MKEIQKEERKKNLRPIFPSASSCSGVCLVSKFCLILSPIIARDNLRLRSSIIELDPSPTIKSLIHNSSEWIQKKERPSMMPRSTKSARFVLWENASINVTIKEMKTDH